MKQLLLILCAVLPTIAFSQKKSLTHDVYDQWKSAGERIISPNGQYVAYTINPQEGDGMLYVKSAKGDYLVEIPRGYNLTISKDSKYAFFKIKSPFQETRQARIKKKRPEDMPKDSLGFLFLGKTETLVFPRVKSYKTPEKGNDWIAFHQEKPLPDTTKKKVVIDSLKRNIDLLTKMADSVIRKSLDSVKGKITKEEVLAAAQKAAKEILKNADQIEALEKDADDDVPMVGAANNEGTDLLVRQLSTGKNKTFKLVSEYLFDTYGNKLLIETTKNSKDSNSKALILLYDLKTLKVDTIMKGFNDAKNYAFDEKGNQVAFVAERDSSTKALQKFYKLWYHNTAKDTAEIYVDINTVGMQLGTTVSDQARIFFSKDTQKLFFGTAAIKPARDTSLVDFELARLDIWHYNDEYLQPHQLRQLQQELRRSYLAVVHIGEKGIVQLGTDSLESITVVDEGNANWVLGQTTMGNRKKLHWEGRYRFTVYVINTIDGSKQLVKSETLGIFQASPSGKFVYWYDPVAKNYFTYNVQTKKINNITASIKVPLYDVEYDMPDYPSAAGTIGWLANDSLFMVKDQFDIWQVDPNAVVAPKNLTNGFGRKNKISFDYVQLDREKRFEKANEVVLLSSANKLNKEGGLYTKKLDQTGDPVKIITSKNLYASIIKAKDTNVYLFQKTSIAASELYVGSDFASATKITHLAKQQDTFNWLTAELVHWKMFDGKMSEGILYKPENFDPTKKYPVLLYFYERNADKLYNYITPSPSTSIINIPYYVSNGYIVFDPNIYYKTGEPGQSAYNSVVSAAKYLAKLPYVDSTKMGIQGQSWGGYQVTYLITKTNMFKAAAAGAPVVNMTSAYGGIRWGTGINRQFQYEKTQSRIGATLWQRQDLYIKNSPLFYADKVNTPLLIMHNDADGAVPWYQGIEYFTALRRLDKKVWMLQYNGEDHNLLERKNRKDLSMRLSQFFDYYLKGAKPARWITEGLPATRKGMDWGFDVP